MYTADTLSRVLLSHFESDCHKAASIEEQVIKVISQLPAAEVI